MQKVDQRKTNKFKCCDTLTGEMRGKSRVHTSASILLWHESDRVVFYFRMEIRAWECWSRLYHARLSSLGVHKQWQDGKRARHGGGCSPLLETPSFRAVMSPGLPQPGLPLGGVGLPQLLLQRFFGVRLSLAGIWNLLVLRLNCIICILFHFSVVREHSFCLRECALLSSYHTHSFLRLDPILYLSTRNKIHNIVKKRAFLRCSVKPTNIQHVFLFTVVDFLNNSIGKCHV